MAKAPAQAPTEAEAPPKKSKKLLIIIVAVVMVLLIAAVGVVLLLVNKNKGADAEAETETHSKVDLSKPPIFVPLDAFTVNLNPAEGDRYLQVVVVLRVADAHVGDSLKAFMPEIRHRINLLLSSKLPSELSTMEGREVLADDIREEANYVLGYEPPKRGKGDGGPIQAVLFNSLIIQ